MDRAKVTLIMLQTLNGKISHDSKDMLQWGGKADKQNFSLLTKSIGTIVMGSKTFEAMGKKPLPERRTIVLTSRPADYSELAAPNLEFTSSTPIKLLETLSRQGIKTVALVGGGSINAAFLSEQLIDEIIVTLAPVIFTSGIDIFGSDRALSPSCNFSSCNLKLLHTNQLDENTLALHYQVVSYGPNKD
jgi:dihydrofolate reductase